MSIQSLHLEKHVILHGSQNHGWVANKLKQVRTFVQHSTEAEESNVERIAHNMIKVLVVPSEQLNTISMHARRRILTHICSDQTFGKLAGIIKQAVQA